MNSVRTWSTTSCANLWHIYALFHGLFPSNALIRRAIMSFGFSVGDFITVGELALKVCWIVFSDSMQLSSAEENRTLSHRRKDTSILNIDRSTTAAKIPWLSSKTFHAK